MITSPDCPLCGAVLEESVFLVSSFGDPFSPFSSPPSACWVCEGCGWQKLMEDDDHEEGHEP